ncbi:hypothetical protein JXB41_03655 [Candidatus Woesearchaeota archaeon]|nr:hypothetical protein [Candidatus Woesearchaeota archaeon]
MKSAGKITLISALVAALVAYTCSTTKLLSTISWPDYSNVISKITATRLPPSEYYNGILVCEEPSYSYISPEGEVITEELSWPDITGALFIDPESGKLVSQEFDLALYHERGEWFALRDTSYTTEGAHLLDFFLREAQEMSNSSLERRLIDEGRLRELFEEDRTIFDLKSTGFLPAYQTNPFGYGGIFLKFDTVKCYILEEEPDKNYPCSLEDPCKIIGIDGQEVSIEPYLIVFNGVNEVHWTPEGNIVDWFESETHPYLFHVPLDKSSAPILSENSIEIIDPDSANELGYQQIAEFDIPLCTFDLRRNYGSRRERYSQLQDRIRFGLHRAKTNAAGIALEENIPNYPDCTAVSVEFNPEVDNYTMGEINAKVVFYNAGP